MDAGQRYSVSSYGYFTCSILRLCRCTVLRIFFLFFFLNILQPLFGAVIKRNERFGVVVKVKEKIVNEL